MSNTENYTIPLRAHQDRPERGDASVRTIGRAKEMLIIPPQEHRLEKAPEEKKEVVPPKNMVPKVSIEYQAPHWYIVVKTPSGKWEAICDATKRVTLQNAFGDTLQTKPAIETYKTYQHAFQELTRKMPHHRLVKRSSFFSSLGSLVNPFSQ